MSRKLEAGDGSLDRQMKTIESNYALLKDFGGNAREKYEEIYLRMVKEIQGQHIENLLETLRNREKYVVKNVDEVMDKLRNHIASQLIRIQEKFWIKNEVSQSLITLEMCKQKYQDYKGIKNW